LMLSLFSWEGLRANSSPTSVLFFFYDLSDQHRSSSD
jgi:hypothetical protein